MPGSPVYAGYGDAMMRRAPSRGRGFTLLELLLAIALLGLLLVGLYKLFDAWAQSATNRMATGQILRVQKAAEDFTRANFETIRTQPAGAFTQITIAQMIAGNHLPAGFNATTNLRQSITAYRRNLVVNKLSPTGGPEFRADGVTPITIVTTEVVTVTGNPAAGVLRVPNKRLLDAAQAGGPKMGVVSQIVMPGKTFTNRASSILNQWYVALADLAAAGYNATPDAQGGYLAAYGLVNTEATDPNNRWLYRVSIDGSPELNQMATDLRMNNHRVENVGTMVADHVQVEGNAAFRGVSDINTTGASSQAMTVEQALRVDGSESRFMMRPENQPSVGGCVFTQNGANRSLTGSGCTMAGGEMQVIADTNNATMVIGDLTSDGSIITDNTNVTSSTVSNGVSTFNNVTGGSMAMAGNAFAPITRFNGWAVTTGAFQASTLDVTTGAAARNSLVAAQVNPGSGKSFVTPTMDVGNAVEVQDQVQAWGMHADTVLDIQDVHAYMPNNDYQDTKNGHNFTCSPYNGRVYCEPLGTHYWESYTIMEVCMQGGVNYYTCQQSKWNGAAYIPTGFCNHVRAVGNSQQAYHESYCAPGKAPWYP